MKNFPKQVFITGIGTGVGKTLASAVLCEALHADYWKPIQCGNLENTDMQEVASLISNSYSQLHQEAYRLKTPSSPHFAALKEDLEIDLDIIRVPETRNKLLVEGAGGILVPVNGEMVMFDLVAYFRLPVIVVVRNYLGSINHTLLTTEFLESRGTEVLGIVFSGSNFNDNEEIIEHFTQLPVLGRIAEAPIINLSFVAAQAELMRKSLSKIYTF